LRYKTNKPVKAWLSLSMDARALVTFKLISYELNKNKTNK